MQLTFVASDALRSSLHARYAFTMSIVYETQGQSAASKLPNYALDLTINDMFKNMPGIRIWTLRLRAFTILKAINSITNCDREESLVGDLLIARLAPLSDL